MTVSPLYTYKKALKVIDSCENEIHIIGAKKYCNNFFTQHSKESYSHKFGLKQYITSDYISIMYERLKRKIHLKELDVIG